MMYTLIVALLWAVRANLRWSALLQPEVLEPLALAATFFGLYCGRQKSLSPWNRTVSQSQAPIGTVRG